MFEDKHELYGAKKEILAAVNNSPIWRTLMPESESKIPKELLEKAAHLGARRQRVNEIVADLYIGAREGGKAKDPLEPATEAILKELDEALASEREKIRKWIDENLTTDEPIKPWLTPADCAGIRNIYRAQLREALEAELEKKR